MINYHDIRTDDMLNGDGLRVVVFLSGCDHNCKNCQNPETHDPESGIEFDINAIEEIIDDLSHDYISGITFSGGDPLYVDNISVIKDLVEMIKDAFPDKTIWIYTGYTWERILYYGTPDSYVFSTYYDNLRYELVKQCDVLVDGKYIDELKDINYPWAGSTNQRVINVKESLRKGEVILWK